MTDDEKRDIKARLLLDYHEAKETLSLLEAKAARFAEALEKGASLLRKTPERIDSPDNRQFPTYAQIVDLAQEIKQAKMTLVEKRTAAQNLGLSLP
jgi:hypothetical protein